MVDFADTIPNKKKTLKLGLKPIVQNKTLIDNLKIGDKISLKGKCDGFDMIMGVVLTRCFIVEE